ncbi:hypothetical protein [Lacihabitans sp. CS3-21]|uniref:hypothetical protein n=1 Tax=Lacihabitans sp. CS3-21 TaxID=2487332 RepID=UPI0020CDC1C2|nr:hypothetical protein [Lacihabitans sp. CS3-21]MCP9749226.1 hypothetical protein [Lacihabitans sp. CS3-21]
MSFSKNILSSITSFIASIFRGIANLVNAFLNKFKKPYHSSSMSFRGLLHSMAIAVGVFVVLFVFQPFGIKEIEESEKMMILIICGVIALASMLVCQFAFPFVAKSFYDEHHWNGSKQLIQSLLMSIMISLGLSYFLASKNIGNISFPVDGLVFFAFTIIPLVLFIFVQETMHDSKYKRKAENLNSDLKNKSVVNSDNPLKILVFKGNNEKLSLIPNQLIYAKIDGNTSEFFYQNPFGIDKSVITIDSKEVLNELIGHPQFVKFSENIMLNTNAIQKISGSARGYDIAIARVNEMVKVSGKFKKNIEKL